MRRRDRRSAPHPPAPADEPDEQHDLAIAERAALYTSSTEYVFASSSEIGLDAVLDAIAGLAARFPDRSSP